MPYDNKWIWCSSYQEWYRLYCAQSIDEGLHKYLDRYLKGIENSYQMHAGPHFNPAIARPWMTSKICRCTAPGYCWILGMGSEPQLEEEKNEISRRTHIGLKYPSSIVIPFVLLQ